MSDTVNKQNEVNSSKRESQASATPKTDADIQKNEEGTSKPESEASATPKTDADIQGNEEGTSKPESEASTTPKTDADIQKNEEGTSKPVSEASATPKTDAEIQKTFNEEGITVHNEYRKKHGVPDLKYSEEMKELALQWAKKLAAENKFKHRPDNKFGENIYSSFSTAKDYEVTAKEACDKWYSEIKDHRFGQDPKGTFKSGHFTQMIWKESEELGMGTAKSVKGQHYVVANYNPAGNMMGKFKDNVPKAN